MQLIRDLKDEMRGNTRSVDLQRQIDGLYRANAMLAGRVAAIEKEITGAEKAVISMERRLTALEHAASQPPHLAPVVSGAAPVQAVKTEIPGNTTVAASPVSKPAE